MKSLMLIVACLIASTAHADDRAVFHEHVRKGTRAYNLGHYRDAVAEFEAAYQLKDDPAILFNIGQAYRAAGDYASAVTAYKSYVRNLPKGERHRDITARIQELETVLAAQQKAQAGPPEGTLPHGEGASTDPVKPEEPAPPPAVVSAPVPAEASASPAAPPTVNDAASGRKKLYAGLGVAVVGVGALVAGGVMGALATSAENQFLHPKDGAYSASADDRRVVDQRAEIALFAAGGAAVVTGAVLMAVGAKQMKRARLSAQISTSVSPGRVAAAVAVSF
jgi:tetratricopeptide (TPR) repeat protein